MLLANSLSGALRSASASFFSGLRLCAGGVVIDFLRVGRGLFSAGREKQTAAHHVGRKLPAGLKRRADSAGPPFQGETKMIEAKPTFTLGQTVITPPALNRLHPADVLIALGRHANGDWGECGEEDWQENELSLEQGFRLMSVYRDRDGTKFWIITEADRSATTVLLPEDY
jgi:hypothetical protein